MASTINRRGSFRRGKASRRLTSPWPDPRDVRVRTSWFSAPAMGNRVVWSQGNAWEQEHLAYRSDSEGFIGADVPCVGKASDCSQVAVLEQK